jgi:hypothetical protein
VTGGGGGWGDELSSLDASGLDSDSYFENATRVCFLASSIIQNGVGPR